MRFREAVIGDARNLFDWRNDPVTCENSINSEPISWESHVAWLNKSLKSSDRKLFIAELDGVPIGTVRYDKIPEGDELSWTVSPASRSRGIGYRMVSEALGNRPAQIARIKRDNIASQKIAVKTGFILSEDSELQIWIRP